MKKKLFKTDTIDLAGYLWTLGIKCLKVEKLGLNHAVFTFEDSNGDCLRHQEKYMTGKAEVNLAAYMYGRTQLKYKVNKLPLPFVSNHVEKPTIKVGESYWCLTNGIPFVQVFAEKEPHLERVKSGNVFPSKDSALDHWNKIKA